MARESAGKKLREAVAESTIQVPGAFNALVAKMIEQAGFDAMYLSGAAFSVGTFGLPDVGLFTLTELAQQTGLHHSKSPGSANRRRRHGVRRGRECRADDCRT